MYHSDYESDLEGPIPVKWRAAYSDTEDSELSYRRVTPKLKKGLNQRNEERKRSPPCPHMWESHEEIEKLENELKNTRRNQIIMKTREKNKVSLYAETTTNSCNISSTNEYSESADITDEKPVIYEVTAIATSSSNLIDEKKEANKKVIETGHMYHEENDYHKKESPPPIPPKNRLNVLTPSPSRNGVSPVRSVDSGSFSDGISSQSTIRLKAETDYIKVKEKVMHFEKKVLEDYMRQSLEEEESGVIRPESIPGAIRILPTPTPPGSCPGSRPGSRSSSRKNSLVRSNSVDNSASQFARCNLLSPITTPRSLQQSPAFVRRHDNPPPMFKPPDPDLIQHTLGQLAQDNSTSGFRSVKLVLAEKERYDKLSEEKDPTPPTDFETPLAVEGKPRPNIDIKRTVEEIKRERTKGPTSLLQEEKREISTYNYNFNAMETSRTFTEENAPPRPPPPQDEEYYQPTISRSDTCSSIGQKSLKSTDCMNITSPPPLETVQINRYGGCMTDEDNDIGKSRINSKVSQDSSIDGYEADTDTLTRRRGSVKDIAARFESRERNNPSPVPRPRGTSVQRFKTPEPSFNTSTAYVPPKWVANTNYTDNQSNYSTCQQISQKSEEIRTETKMIRINQQNISSTKICENSTMQSQSMFSLALPDSASLCPPPPSPSTPSHTSSFVQSMEKSLKDTQPEEQEGNIEMILEVIPTCETGDTAAESEKIKACWTPDSLNTAQPEYKPVRPTITKPLLPNQKEALKGI